MRRVAIIQSNYIPWKGYFDIIHDVDTFVFLDDVQMTKRDWRTRNKIKTPRGAEWLTVPVKGGRDQLICETEIAQDNWQKQHLKTLQTNYSRAPYFHDYGPLLEFLYSEPHTNLSAYNREAIGRICALLGIETELLSSFDLAVEGAKDDRILSICSRLGATRYLSGPAARDYIVEEKFADAGIELVFKDYTCYPPYPQLFPPFDHAVSILDLLFHCGPSASQYIWGWRTDVQAEQGVTASAVKDPQHDR